MILKRAKDYYRNNRDELRVKARDKSEKDLRENMEETDIIMSEEDKQRLKQYKRNYRRSRQTT